MNENLPLLTTLLLLPKPPYEWNRQTQCVVQDRILWIAYGLDGTWLDIFEGFDEGPHHRDKWIVKKTFDPPITNPDTEKFMKMAEEEIYRFLVQESQILQILYSFQ